MIHKFSLSLGALCVAFAVHAYAEEQTTLDTITVNANASEVKANQIKKTRKAIQEELISDNYDLVRYATDVGIIAFTYIIRFTPEPSKLVRFFINKVICFLSIK